VAPGPLAQDARIVAARDPNFGELVFKDGTRTGATTGIEDVYAFWECDISPAPVKSETPAENRERGS
jgi:hypothetical protein